jgi:hypothetical protein
MTKVPWQTKWVGLNCMICLVLLLLSTWAESSKRLPVVTATFSVESSAVRVGDQAHVVLHLMALQSAPDIEARFILPPEVSAVSGGMPWSGGLDQNATLDLPLTVRILQEGEYSIGAIVKAGEEVAGAMLNVLATAQDVEMSTDPIAVMKLRGTRSQEERQKLLDSPPHCLPQHLSHLYPLVKRS